MAISLLSKFHLVYWLFQPTRFRSFFPFLLFHDLVTVNLLRVLHEFGKPIESNYSFFLPANRHRAKNTDEVSMKCSFRAINLSNSIPSLVLRSFSVFIRKSKLSLSSNNGIISAAWLHVINLRIFAIKS